MSTPSGACADCLRRAGLLQALAPLIEVVATRGSGSSVRELLALRDDELRRTLAPRGAAALDRARRREPTAGEIRSRLAATGAWSTCRHRPGYPEPLRDLDAQAPAALFARGDRALLEQLGSGHAVAVVGTRRASAYGRTIGSELGRALAAAGVIVVSGMAHGVDSAAHEGALAGSGPTAAILGAGPDRAYPRGRWRLFERIVAEGLVLSELPPQTRPYRWTFPARNRIMAALAHMTVVVEAAVRSGSLITAEMALDLGRELGAVPGPVNATRHEGANRLLIDGAHLIRDAQDVLDLLFGPGAGRAVQRGAALEGRQGAVLARIEAGDGTCDAIATAIGAPPGEVAAAVADLELVGYVESAPDGRYARTARREP